MCLFEQVQAMEYDNWTVNLLGFGDEVRTYVFQWIRGFYNAPLWLHYRVCEFVFQYQSVDGHQLNEVSTVVA